jgi:(2Fe-2S) ferredoxin
MVKRAQPYRRQIYVCINNRHGESPSCGHSGSEEIVEELRKAAKDLNLKGKLRVARSGCLDVCAFGPNMMIWPEGLWYMKVAKDDVPEIVKTYMQLEEADKTKEAAVAK